MAWNVYFFQTASGDCPVRKFIKEQDEVVYTKILHLVMLLKDHGPLLRPPYSKKMQNNLYELRVSGSIAIRIFYTLYRNEYFLLHAFKKKSQKTPHKEIKTALDRMRKLI